MALLYVVATPIGNLGDLSPRMAEALSACDLIAAEDTRVTMKLLNHLGIQKPMVSCHRHNEQARSRELADRMLREDLTVAVTCDAGTPGISDPGTVLVRTARECGIPVVPIAGPSAVATVLSVAGFDAGEFAFYGFLPREKKPLREKLQRILETGIPVAVVYESPHRVLALAEEMAEAWPGARLCVACDLTKRFERILTGAAPEIARELKALPNLEKGEYCLAADLREVGRPERQQSAPMPAEAAIFLNMLSGMDLDEAAGTVENVPRNELYRAKLRVRAFLESEE